MVSHVTRDTVNIKDAAAINKDFISSPENAVFHFSKRFLSSQHDIGVSGRRKATGSVFKWERTSSYQPLINYTTGRVTDLRSEGN